MYDENENEVTEDRSGQENESTQPEQPVRDYYADGTPAPRRTGQEPPRPSATPNYDSYRFGSAEPPKPGLGRGADSPRRNGKKGNKAAAIIAVLLAFSLFVGLLVAGIGHLGKYLRSQVVVGERAPESTELQPQQPEKAPVTLAPSRQETDEAQQIYPPYYMKTVADVAEESMPAMVSITSMTVQQVYSFFGQAQSYEVPSAGSGIIVGMTDDELLIATNDHVISGTQSLSVCFVDEEAAEGVVKGEDVKNDLAIVAVRLDDLKQETKDAITIIPIGDSDKLRIGEQVVAIGNALGFGQSVSGGYVSALNREVNVDGEVHTLLQTDAAINPGNSGGALLNMNGELIGINEVKYVATNTEGIGYAIPITFARPILDELMNRQTRVKVDDSDRGYLGITCITVTEQYSQTLHIPTGAYVDSVSKNGAAQKAGLRPRDIITAIGDVSVNSTDELINELQYYRIGDELLIRFSRLGEDNEYAEQEVTVTLEERPADLNTGNMNP